MHLEPLDVLPLWAMTLIIATLLVASCELGFRFGGRKNGAEKSDQGHVLSAMLALLGLLVGFTFSIAVGRYETRRTLVVDEANAIGTEYLRAQMVPEPYRSRLMDVLRHYVDARLELAAAAENDAAIARAEARTDSLHQRMWAATVEAVPTVQPAALSSLLEAGMNTVIDAAALRRAAIEARLPAIVFGSLGLYALVAAGMLGFVSGSGRHRSRVGAVVLLLLLTLALGLILDLDRPRQGAITVSQQPLIDLRESMRRHGR